ncbi:MAG: type II toxin-antitoxin system RelE family toxin [Bryobacteraceae bacterium]
MSLSRKSSARWGKPRADIRAIERESLRLLKALARFIETDAGNVKQLQGFEPPRYRPRIGDWRLIFRVNKPDVIELVRVRNRGEAYR